MKKVFVMMMILCFTCSVFAQVAKEAVKPAEKVVLTQADWVKANDEAKLLCSEAKYLEASDKYIAAGKIAKEVLDGYADVRWAWVLNNAAYMIILEHKKDNKVSLSKALEYLTEAKTIEKIDKDCVRCVESNLAYVEYFNSKPVEVKKEVTVEKKK